MIGRIFAFIFHTSKVVYEKVVFGKVNDFSN